MDHKKQHWVPQSYLAAWCDPSVPDGQEPYVWCFPREGGLGKRKAPKNLFAETNMYTITRDDGSRDLSIERGLAGLEGDFAEVRRETLQPRREPTAEDKFIVCAFMAAAQVRTRAQRDHLATEWGKMLAHMERMKEAFHRASPKQQRAMCSIEPPSDRASLSEEDVRRLAASPLQETFITILREQMRVLPHMHLTIFCTASDPGFITSDAPCAWFDPEAHRRPFPFNGVGLAFPTVEITLPVSPQQIAVLTHRPLARGSVYVDLEQERFVDELNRRTRFNCDEYFVVRREVTRPVWYDPGRPPEQPSTSG